MKTISALAAATLSLLPVTVLAGGDKDWAEKAARGYEEKARWAENQGKPRAAEIYRRMAEIKRDAGRASRAGKKFSWDEYHALEGKLNALKKDHHKNVYNKPKNKDCDKPHVKKDAGEGFMRAAENYRKQAAQARANGHTDKAHIFAQLADMKVAAANAAKDGNGYDWSKYYALKKKLHGGGECDKKADANKDCDKPQQKWDAANKPAPAGKFNIE